jgi:hypothetical protein
MAAVLLSTLLLSLDPFHRLTLGLVPSVIHPRKRSRVRIPLVTGIERQGVYSPTMTVEVRVTEWVELAERHVFRVTPLYQNQ